MSFERLLKDKPQFHIWSDGTPTSYAVSPRVLEFLLSCLEPGMLTLETGAGYSTVIFAIAGTIHTCVTPSEAESKRIMDYCSKIELKPRITFLNESSDFALANPNNLPDHLDLVFIDGAHRFPYPCIDFHFTEGKLVVGGILALDDITLPSVRILYNFLCSESEWQKIKEVDGTAFFKRVQETTIINDWQGQNINRQFLIKAKALRSIKSAGIAIKKMFGIIKTL